MKTGSTDIRQDLNTRGLKATPQRLAVMAAINQAEGYFTPHELYESLKVKHSEIGLVTVYRTLAALTQAGLICQIESTGETRIYARRSRAHHHHLVCGQCSRVMEFNECELKSLIEKVPFLTLIDTFRNPLEANSLLARRSADLIFADQLNALFASFVGVFMKKIATADLGAARQEAAQHRAHRRRVVDDHHRDQAHALQFPVRRRTVSTRSLATRLCLVR